jgi:hypothetical protein
MEVPFMIKLTKTGVSFQNGAFVPAPPHRQESGHDGLVHPEGA